MCEAPLSPFHLSSQPAGTDPAPPYRHRQSNVVVGQHSRTVKPKSVHSTVWGKAPKTPEGNARVHALQHDGHGYKLSVVSREAGLA